MPIATSTALIAATVASTAASAGSAIVQRGAAKSANKTIRNAAEQARADQAPWRTAGEKALQAYEQKVSAGPGDYKESPGYKFRVSEGERAIKRAASARGELWSGKQVKELVNYNQNVATDDYDRYLRRYYDSLEPLRVLSGVGQAAASNQAATTERAASQIGAGQRAAGAAVAGGLINAANVMRSGARDMVTMRQAAQQNATVESPATAQPVNPIGQQIYA